MTGKKRPHRKFPGSGTPWLGPGVVRNTVTVG